MTAATTTVTLTGAGRLRRAAHRRARPADLTTPGAP